MHLWKHSLRGKTLIFAITAAACQAFLLLGFDQGVMADPDMQGHITTLYDIGCVVGSIICYFVGERFSRRTMLLTRGSIMVVGTAILASSTTIAQLIVGRIVTGIGNRMNSSTAPVYLMECAPPSYRGALLTLQGRVTILGVVIAYWLGYGKSYTASSIQWRFPLAFQAIFAILLVLQIIGLPEAPRWLVQHDKYEETRAVTAALEDKPLDDPEFSSTILDIRVGLEEGQHGGPFRFKELFTWSETQNLRRLSLIISIQLGQQFTGSNMINYYAPVIFQDSMHLSRNLSLILGGAAQCTYLVGSTIPVLLMDRFGRRNLLMMCTAGLCFCFVMVSTLLSLGTEGPAYGATAFIFLFQIVYGIGWLPVPWFYPSEISTTHTRSKMQVITSGWNWMFVFTVVKIMPISFDNIGWKTFIIFAVLNAASIPMVYCFYPETQGITLVDVPLLFHKGGCTGGVLKSKGGRTVVLNQHAQEAHVDEKMASKRMEAEETGTEVKA